MKEIADHKKTKTQNLFMRCRHEVCRFLVNAMHDAQSGKMTRTAGDILGEVSSVLGYPDVKTFLLVGTFDEIWNLTSFKHIQKLF